MHDCYIAEMDRMSSSIGRSLQAYLDTLDFSPYLKEVETPTLLRVGEESPTSTLDQHRGSWPSSCRIVGWRSVPAWDHGINAIHRSGAPNRHGSFPLR